MRKLNRKTGLIALTLLLSQTALMPTAFTKQNEVIVKDSLINVRSGAGLDYPIVAKVEEGNRFTVLERKGEWLKIQVNDEKNGWVAEWLVTAKGENSEQESVSASGTITAEGLRLRKGPGTSYPIVSVLSKDTKVEVTGQSGSWVEIQAGSSIGFISEEYIRMDSADHTIGTITADSVHLRSGPSPTAEILGKIKKGSSAEIINAENGWTNIQYQGHSYWISSQYINKRKADSRSGKLSIEITASSLNVRSSPKMSSHVIGSVKKGNTYKVRKIDGRWYEIMLEDGQKGWIASWYAKPLDNKTSPKRKKEAGKQITITRDKINIRTGPGTNQPIAKQANLGDSYKLIGMKDNWAEIELSDGSSGFIANWLLSSDSKVRPASAVQAGSLTGKLIVLDAGHGGMDSGAIGTSGLFEKQLTLRTALLLSSKLKQQGASVLLTRGGDQYISLSDRAHLANQQDADAFISIHYDSAADIGAGGITTYYTHGHQLELASHIQHSLLTNSQSQDRGVKQASLRVLRENKRPAVLVELGYISNPAEESLLHTARYQELVTNGLLNGLKSFLNK
ncbi:SH3 domain-containing protein [Pradoshia sp.]|uniref:SH3 domain-containing protein n=1 Tax=Pradoshia sp. TaxID=2651281 RepID=UPI003F0F3CDC